MPKNEVKIVITGDSAQAVNAVKKLEGETQSLTSKIKSHWVAAAAAIAGAMVTVHKGLEYMDLGAKVQQAEESLNRGSLMATPLSGSWCISRHLSGRTVSTGLSGLTISRSKLSQSSSESILTG